MTKKTVMFGSVLGFKEHPSGALQALLGDVKQHYRLGDCPSVTTSAVLRIAYADPKYGERTVNEIETLNTIYKRIEE